MTPNYFIFKKKQLFGKNNEQNNFLNKKFYKLNIINIIETPMSGY